MTHQHPDVQAMNEAIFQKLAPLDPVLDKAAGEAVGAFMQEMMWRYRHIPFRYFIPELEPIADLKVLAATIHRDGYLDLDEDGKFSVLTGKPAKLTNQPQAPVANDDA